MRIICSALCVGFLALSASVASAAGIRGDYVEARTADVFTGPCFSNAEVFIYGNHAVLAWKVNEGVMEGSRLPRAVRRSRRQWNNDLLGGSTRQSHRRTDRR